MIFKLDNNSYAPFPDVSLAETEPDGLLALGGDLSPERLMNAYRSGIFPWYGPDDPILWWSPDPRLVLYPEKLKISRSLRKRLARKEFQISFDRQFEAVIRACAEPRTTSPGTWLAEEMIQAYIECHRRALAHSVEVWQGEMLVGGLYGIAIGAVFFGESMFSRVSDASKCALVGLTQQLTAWGFELIDCQVYTSHLASLGAETIPRKRFSQALDQGCILPDRAESWANVPMFFPRTQL